MAILRKIIYAILIVITATNPVLAKTEADTAPYSMAISGGISLGNYEAGMNWAIIESFRLFNKGNIQLSENENLKLYGDLGTITGASAGSINALISALRYCQKDEIKSSVDNNLFYKTWLNIGFDGLLPNDDEDYDQALELKNITLKDGVLSRKPFKDVVNALKRFINQKTYKKGCNVRIGMSLTRENAIKTTISNVELLTQRFFVPLELSIDENNQAVFRNYMNMDLGNNGYGNIVFLPEANDRISADLVIATALASTAFPVAFGRVLLDICDQNTTQDKLDYGSCPTGYFTDRAVFVDGGVFDNIPLGIARILAEDEKNKDGTIRKWKYEKPFSYIYLSPSNIRYDDNRMKGENENILDRIDGRKLNYGILDQMGFVSDTITIGMASELYSTLRSYDWNNVKVGEKNLKERYRVSPKKEHPRRILLTSRGSPLTADYLSHFGAFAAKEFREYDYYIGVYDGMYNVAKSLCNDSQNNNDNCRIRLLLLLHEKLGIENKSDYIFTLMFNKDFCNGGIKHNKCSKSVVDNDNPYYILYDTMNKSENLDFGVFLKDLIPNSKVFKDATLQKMMLYKNLWYIDYAKKITGRMQYLEDKASEETEQAKLVSLSNYIVNSVDVNEDDFTWSISSAPSPKFPYLYYLIPDEIGFDVSQSGSVFTYRANTDPLFYGFYPEFEGGLHFVSDVTGENDFMHAGVNFRKRVSGVFSLPVSSVGLGFGYYKDFTSWELEDTETNLRLNLSIGIFADKFRITYGQRIDEDTHAREQSRMIILSITDVKGLIHWLF